MLNKTLSITDCLDVTSFFLSITSTSSVGGIVEMLRHTKKLTFTSHKAPKLSFSCEYFKIDFNLH